MCEKCEHFEETMISIAESMDPAFGDGQNPNGWLSWEPTISDRQLDVFERMLSTVRDQLEHAGNGPRAFATTELGPMLPPNAAIAVIHELQMHRFAAAMNRDSDTWEIRD